MSENEVPKDTQLRIANNSIDQLNLTICDLRMQYRVAMSVNDKEMKTRCFDQLTKYEKMRDEYKKIVAEINFNNHIDNPEDSPKSSEQLTLISKKE